MVKDSERERAGGKVVVLVVVGLLLLVGAGWAAAYVGAGDKVPRGTTVAGVDIGGRTPAEATTTLESEFADRAEAPVIVSIEGSTEEVAPSELGLSVDHEASVAAAGGGESWDPQRLWDYYTGGDDLEAVVLVDDEVMQTALERLDSDLGQEPVDGAVVFEGAQVVTTEAVTGRTLDLDQAREAIVAAYLSEEGGDPATAELMLVDDEPAIDAGDVQAALDDFANPAMSAPVTLLFDDSPVRLTPRQYAGALAMKARDGELVPTLDQKRLTRLVAAAISDGGAPVDATVRLVDGEPKVVPAKPGVTYEPDDVADAFLDLVARPEGEREVAVEATVAKADRTTAEARKLRITERVSTFTTYFPYAEYRNTNIGRAAEIVDGTVLEPGDVFSMNDIVGERTRENGFTEGFIISDGIFKEDLGGGVSQLATTLFNAMFFAGLKDVEHKPHSFYIDRYPVGREATVAFGAVDLRFENDTPYGVLVDTNVVPSTPSSQGSVTVSIYSTKYWDITTTTSDRYAFVPPATRRLDTPDCYPNEGYSGFQIDVTRFFRRAGEDELVREEVFHTDYTPSDTVICE